MKIVLLPILLIIFLESLSANSLKKVDLTEKEKNYLQSINYISMCIDPKWFPFEEIDENGKHIGMTSDYMNLFSQWIGKTIRLVPTKTWKETLEKAKAKECDIIAAAVSTNERREYLNFTKPYLIFPEVIATRGNVPFIEDIEIFQYQGIGVVKNSAIEGMLQAKYPEMVLVPVNNINEGLKEVARGNIFGFINTSVSIGHAIANSEFQDLKISGSIGIDYELGTAVRKDAPELLSILDKAIDLITKDEHIKIKQKWISVKFESGFDYTLLLQILAVLSVITLISFYWIRKLRAEIKERVKAEKEVNKLSQAVEFSPTMVIITDTEGIIEYVNHAFCSITGFSRKEANGRKMNIVRSQSTGDKTYRTMWDTILHGDTWAGELINRRKDGADYWVSVSISPVFNKQGEVTNFLSISEDISEKKENQFKLQEAMENAQAATKAKSAFLANMSHDIRTPLNSIIGFSDILKQKIDNPVHKDYLSTIINGSHTLLNIINDILDLSKIEAGKMNVNNESVDTKKLFRDLGQFFLGAAKDKKLDLIVDVAEDLPEYILIDGTRVKQIAMNLLSNSIKFTHKGSITLKVWCKYTEETGSVLDLYFYVEDTGIGINENSINKIFNDFEQQEGQSVEYGGTGLGLSICKKLSNMLNGDVWVESKLGEGSRFSVEFKDVHVSSAKVSEASDEEVVTFTQGSVILADDIADNRKLVRAFLESSKLDIYEAENGLEVLQILEKNREIDLIILDIKMPVMTGYEAIVKVREQKHLAHIPIIALTASVMGEDSYKIEELGFNGYLRKPVSKSDFMNELKKYLTYDEKLVKKYSYEFDFNIDDYGNLKENLDEYIYELQEVKDSGDFSRIEDFINKLNSLGVVEAKEYIEEMLVHLESINIIEVNHMLEYLVEKLEGMRS